MKNRYLLTTVCTLLISAFALGQTVSLGSDEPQTNQYSNDKIATSIKEILSTTNNKEILGNEKVEKDLIIVLKNDGEITSYDLESLNQKWNIKFTDSSYNKMRNQFKIENSILYATSTQKEIIAANVNDGSLYWKTEIGMHSGVDKRYVISGQHLPIQGNLIFLASNNKQLYAFNKYTGDKVWNYKLQFPYNNYTPVLNKENLVISNAPYVYSFKSQTGQAIWQRGFGNTPMYSLMQIDDKKAYVANEYNKVYALNIDDMASIAWEYQTEDKYANIDSNTILDGGTYYFASETDSKTLNVNSLNSDNGELIWKTSLNIEGDDVRYFSKYNNYIFGFTKADDNAFFMLNATDGKQLKIRQPKEKILSNIFVYNGDLSFLTKNFFVTYNLKANKYTYKDIKLKYEVNDAFNLYFEIVKAN